ncbi:MAG: metallophosphoesterase family protein [Clostridia bacterium]|nr:metallophosphoesterase family protein [Clostridia bacterium]
MKKVIAMLMSAVIFVTCTAVSFALPGEAKLQFDENGKFKILLLADIQDGAPIEDALVEFMNETLDKTDPDLVIFLGDNIMSPEDGTEESYWNSYDAALEPIVSRGIPFTLVFGNHDDESMENITKEEMLAKYMSYDGCLAYDADPSLHGCGTHNLEVLSSDSSRIALNLWLMDSGDYIYDENGERDGYDCVREDQLEWYEQKEAELTAKNGSQVPSLMFQHIVTQEVYEKVMLPSPFNLNMGVATKNFKDGSCYSAFMPNFYGYKGYLMEPPCPSLYNFGQWDSLVKTGDVKGIFFGHDHVNNFQTDIDGIQAVSVPGATYDSYNGVYQGATLLTVDENDVENFERENIYASQLAFEDGSQLGGLSGCSNLDYFFTNVGRILLCTLAKVSHILGCTVGHSFFE